MERVNCGDQTTRKKARAKTLAIVRGNIQAHFPCRCFIGGIFHPVEPLKNKTGPIRGNPDSLIGNRQPYIFPSASCTNETATSVFTSEYLKALEPVSDT